MMMVLGYILLENLALDATLSGGDWGETLDHVLDPRITSLPARCADASDLDASQFEIAWEKPPYVTDLALCGHTGGLDARYRLTAYEGEDVLLAIDWTDVYGRLYPSASIPWEQSNWYTGKPRERDIAGYARHLLIRLPQRIAPDRIAVELDVRDTEGDFDLGYLWAGSPLAPAQTYTWGRVAGIRRRTLRETTAGGRQILTRRINARTQTVTFLHLTQAEAYRLYDHAMAEDVHPAIFVPDPADAVNGFREIFPAWLAVTGEPRQVNEFGEWAVTLQFEEMQG